ncbi:DUF2255 family protein [Lactococcus nasutitermitis]|uniref:DUF2255 family protein n=1 Tax=Lactococcus nasutitermitis TaxID=1652957 RepID=A0ABV9JE90_9LACT|nr:DUF2255 family protein [Lactococcus nasutitermitis]
MIDFTSFTNEKDIYICPDPQGHRPVWIGFVLLNNQFYIEAETGKRSSWYQSAIVSGTGQLHLADKIYQVGFTAVTDERLLAEIQMAYYEKYGPEARVMEAHGSEACLRVKFLKEIGLRKRNE